jgi:hypothetical protein
MSWLERYCGPTTECTSQACPSQTHERSHDYIIDNVVHSIFSEDRSIDPYELHRHVKENHPVEVAAISELNGRMRKPPTGKAGSILSRLILVVADELGLSLSPTTEARHQGRAIYNTDCTGMSYGHCPRVSDDEYY